MTLGTHLVLSFFILISFVWLTVFQNFSFQLLLMPFTLIIYYFRNLFLIITLNVMSALLIIIKNNSVFYGFFVPHHSFISVFPCFLNLLFHFATVGVWVLSLLHRGSEPFISLSISDNIVSLHLHHNWPGHWGSKCFPSIDVFLRRTVLHRLLVFLGCEGAVCSPLNGGSVYLQRQLFFFIPDVQNIHLRVLGVCPLKKKLFHKSDKENYHMISLIRGI